MRWSYYCPACQAMLNPSATITLIATQGGNKIVMGFHPEPGNYQIYLPPEMQLEPRIPWNFFCPVCHVDLATPENTDLCALELVEDGERREVLFSRIAGERATYVVADQRVERTFGEHAETYVQHLIQLKYLL